MFLIDRLDCSLPLLSVARSVPPPFLLDIMLTAVCGRSLWPMPHVVMVSATRSMTWRSDDSRSGVPGVPRKYFWATMLVAFNDHDEGISTSFCSKATEPSFQLEIRASRRSHDTESYGCWPAEVK